MSRLPRLTRYAALAAVLPVLSACDPGPVSSSGSGGGTGGTAQVSEPSPQLCRLTKADGGRCVSMQQRPMQPTATDQGYATQVSWILTNECSYPMQVTWGWAEGRTDGEAVLAQGQSAEATCLWNVDGCTGSIDWVYRCSQVR